MKGMCKMKSVSSNSANTRIQWLHKKIANMYYPNAMRLAERFNISHRQAQRDVDYLKKKLGAPLEYSMEHKGYYYSEQYSLPLVLSSDNDDSLTELADSMSGASLQAENTFVQMQIPYTATVEIADKLSVLSLKNFIISKEPRNRYVCEFHNVEQFLSVLITLRSDFKIVEPMWIRERLVKLAKNIIKNNSDD
jgi:predicted DNA-binding transcriptional regulator YafY